MLIHPYGPHYFRTNSDRIVDYLSQFTEWHPVEYKILSWTHGRYWQFPINLNTFEQLSAGPRTSEEMEATLAEWRVPIAEPQNSEEVILSQVGDAALRDVLQELHAQAMAARSARSRRRASAAASPSARIATTATSPKNSRRCPRTATPRCSEECSRIRRSKCGSKTDYREVRAQVRYRHLIYTGPIDEYFDHCFGPLPYRSLRFEPETLAQEFFQPAMQVNYPNDHDFTRIVEIKHATGQKLPVTTIVREYPAGLRPRAASPTIRSPRPTPARSTSDTPTAPPAETGVSFVGRLATYRYYNMDQVVGMALASLKSSASLKN